ADREAVVADRRGLAPDRQEIGRHPLHLSVRALLHARSEPEHRHQHEDAPEHAEGGEEGAQPVAPQRRPHLVPVVEIEHYWSRRAVMGLTRAAARAGKKPASAPAAMSPTVAAIPTPKLIAGFFTKSFWMMLSATPSNATPAASPSKPAMPVRNTASWMIIATIEFGVAPSALRTPISLVRSRTAIIMMFETPTTPAEIG